MTDRQQRVVTSRPTTTAGDALRTKSKQTAEEHWVQDALEDDEVREKCLHVREIMGIGWFSLQRPVIVAAAGLAAIRGDPDPKLVAKHQKGSIAADISRPPSAGRLA